jgi:hypothetical protein
MMTHPPPIRVLIAIGSMNAGGTEGQILEVCRSLGGSRFQFHVVTSEAGGQLLEALDHTGARVHSLGFPRHPPLPGTPEADTAAGDPRLPRRDVPRERGCPLAAPHATSRHFEALSRPLDRA